MSEPVQSAAVTRRGFLDMQVCVPSSWTDKEVLEFAENNNPCGTEGGWQIRKEGSPHLAGAPERNPCTHALRDGFVHIMLDA